MLYVTARDHRDAYTAHRALTLDRAADGGLYIPFRLPRYTPEQIAALADRPFSQNLAEILNVFFGCRLTGYDVEFAIGRAPVRFKSLSHRILVCEMWHNPDWKFDWMVRRLSALMLSSYQISHCSEWTFVAVRIAALFGVFGQLMRSGIIGAGDRVDISLVSGDFSAPMAVWYARVMGLPIGNIVCCCNENNSLWALLHQGALPTDSIAEATDVPAADIAVPASLERLVHACGGYSEAARFLQICRRGGVYAPNEVMLGRMRSGLNVSVISTGRVTDSIRSVYSSYSYLMGPCTALAYGGLLDYRSRAGESRCALVLSDDSPAVDDALIADAMGIPLLQVKELIDQM